MNLAKLRRVKNVLYVQIRVYTVTYISFRFLSPSNAFKGTLFKLRELFCIFLKLNATELEKNLVGEIHKKLHKTALGKKHTQVV